MQFVFIDTIGYPKILSRVKYTMRLFVSNINIVIKIFRKTAKQCRRLAHI